MIRIKSFSQNTVLTFCRNITECNINIFTEYISQRSRLQTTEVTLVVEAGRDLLEEH